MLEKTLTIDAGDVAGRLGLIQAGLDMVNQGFTIIDTDLRLVAWNQTFLEMLEVPRELVRFGAPFEAFMRANAERGEYGPGDVEAMVAARVNAARAFEPHYFERTRPNGRIIAVRGEPLPGRGFVTIYTDITEQRRIERMIRDQNAELERRVHERTEALGRSEKRLRLITDAIPALIASFDRSLVYRFANKGYADWFGHSKEDIVGHPVAEILGPQLYAELAPHIERALEGETVNYEYAVAQADGQMLYASNALVPEFGPDGKVSGVFVLSSDITEQKRAQAALLQAQKMEAVGRLSGGLAHDFNNLLTVVIGNLVRLQELLAGTSALDEYLTPALTASRRGADLIRRLLTFARQQPLEPRPVEIGALIASLELLLRRSLPENIDLRIILHRTPLFALTDPHQLESAVLNLVLNARDAMLAGGALAIDVDRRRIDIDQAMEMEIGAGDYVHLTVSDTGAGMDAATLAHALDPFFTTKAFGSGSGLGLSMVYGFARQSGGALRLSSVPGRGTEVALLLPQGEGAAAPEDEVPALADSFANRYLVLMVEDDPEVRKVVRTQLIDLGYPVIEAQDGAEALRVLDSVAEIRIVLSDLVMPGGVDGRILADRVRATRPGVGVLLMSGYPTDLWKEGEDLELLSKPFSIRELSDALERCMR
ncbi:MAG: PAS-domain containing protein [Betaproteobacteria bacterium]|nr:PAS-domain containing protein [Betaproteobacteria bacterium]